MSVLNHRISVALISIVASVLILAAKWWAYIISGSAALKSDALEGIVNVVASSFALVAVVYAEKPSDKDHPYGHGKIESFSAAFEGGLITLAAMLIFYEGVQAIIEEPLLRKLELGLALNTVAGVANGVLGYFLIRRGRALNSQSIEADGRHILSDFYTTVGIVAGLLLARYSGWYWLDGAIAMVVGLVLGKTGFVLARAAFSALMDSEDPQVLKQLVDALNHIDKKEIIAVHDMRTMRSGRYTHVDAHIVVPEFYSVKQGHDLIEAYCKDVLQLASVEGEFHSHIDPCHRAYCERCPVTPCEVRQSPFKERVGYKVETVTASVP
jgi:cation diffusion facilitator family transporter